MERKEEILKKLQESEKSRIFSTLYAERLLFFYVLMQIGIGFLPSLTGFLVYICDDVVGAIVSMTSTMYGVVTGENVTLPRNRIAKANSIHSPPLSILQDWISWSLAWLVVLILLLKFFMYIPPKKLKVEPKKVLHWKNAGAARRRQRIVEFRKKQAILRKHRKIRPREAPIKTVRISDVPMVKNIPSNAENRAMMREERQKAKEARRAERRKEKEEERNSASKKQAEKEEKAALKKRKDYGTDVSMKEKRKPSIAMMQQIVPPTSTSDHDGDSTKQERDAYPKTPRRLRDVVSTDAEEDEKKVPISDETDAPTNGETDAPTNDETNTADQEKVSPANQTQDGEKDVAITREEDEQKGGTTMNEEQDGDFLMARRNTSVLQNQTVMGNSKASKERWESRDVPNKKAQKTLKGAACWTAKLDAERDLIPTGPEGKIEADCNSNSNMKTDLKRKTDLSIKADSTAGEDSSKQTTWNTEFNARRKTVLKTNSSNKENGKRDWDTKGYGKSDYQYGGKGSSGDGQKNSGRRMLHGNSGTEENYGTGMANSRTDTTTKSSLTKFDRATLEKPERLRQRLFRKHVREERSKMKVTTCQEFLDSIHEAKRIVRRRWREMKPFKRNRKKKSKKKMTNFRRLRFCVGIWLFAVVLLNICGLMSGFPSVYVTQAFIKLRETIHSILFGGYSALWGLVMWFFPLRLVLQLLMEKHIDMKQELVLPCFPSKACVRGVWFCCLLSIAGRLVSYVA